MQLLPTDHDLWNAFRMGDSNAFRLIYDGNISELLSYGYRITNNRQLIKDSIHDLFLHLWIHREKLSETDTIKFYLFRALRNRILKNIRDSPETPNAAVGDLLDRLFAELPSEEAIIEEEHRRNQVRILKSALEKLPQRQQEVIQLRFFHDLDMNHIAALMQINNQSARNLLHRSLLQLRDFFEMAGWVFLSVFKLFQ